ncbi:serine/threonine kinase [Aureococcus anophagefferens]|nr:serine/threonine kinase [Aureococcus anophagefferens]
MAPIIAEAVMYEEVDQTDAPPADGGRRACARRRRPEVRVLDVKDQGAVHVVRVPEGAPSTTSWAPCRRRGRYELIKPIGKGKFAVVYRARRIADDELVALKKIAVDSMDHRAREKCLKEGFEERVIWKYFSQICDALAHMHEQRILHRDLKPANVFLTLNGTVKVGDLGLAA